jgi:hypothetical protein
MPGSKQEDREVRIFVGPPVPIEELLRQLREEEAQAQAARRGRGLMSKRSRVVTATEEDLERIYGSERLLIGFPVRPPGWRPPSSGVTPPEAEQPPGDENSTSS